MRIRKPPKAGIRQRIARSALFVVDLALQWLLKPRNDLIVYASSPDYSDNPYYLYLHALRTRRDIEHVWLVIDLAERTRIEAEFVRLNAAERGHRLRVQHWYSLAAYWAFMRSRTAVHTHGLHGFSRAALRGRLRFGMWHGMVLKRVGRLNTANPNPTPQFATHHFVTSHFFRYVFAQAFEVPLERILVTGQPRNDALIYPQSRALDESTIRERLGFAPDERTVVWLPTFRAEGHELEGARAADLRSFLGDVDSGVLDRLLETAGELGVTLVVKLHPWEKSNAGEALAARPGLRLFNHEQWRAADVPLYDFLAVADAMISDVSSVMVDFAITGKPMGCIGFRAETYARGVAFPLDQFLDAVNVCRLDNDAAIRDFLGRAAKGERAAPTPTAAIFAERPQKPACEAILELIG